VFSRKLSTVEVDNCWESFIPYVGKRNIGVNIWKCSLKIEIETKWHSLRLKSVGQNGRFNEVFARKEEQKEIGQLELNKLRRLHLIYEEDFKYLYRN